MVMVAKKTKTKKKRGTKSAKTIVRKKSQKKQYKKTRKAIEKVQKKKLTRSRTRKVAKRKSLPKRIKAVPEKKSHKKLLKKSQKTVIRKGRTKKITRVTPTIKDVAVKRKKPESKGEDAKKVALRKLLIQKREEIVRKAKEEISRYTRGDARQLVDTALDNGDWSVVDLSEDISLRQLTTHRETLQRIDEALRKLAEGTYGKCEECGEDISEERLKVLPSATCCRDCQEKKEQIEKLEKEEELE